ncbi:hypothetical protein SLEP1_g40812 [Rubroshorea leprosula]|uniref:Uncharacterized protein n=1 Tax=Rubroshorea leprosula TaxID=152421 RepID=A0AAV5L4W1_9ROSI|nr:hypothetical protein SLEP1_g40812 [Rubroshorea leprosula]
MDDVEQLFQCFNASSAASLLPNLLSKEGKETGEFSVERGLCIIRPRTTRKEAGKCHRRTALHGECKYFGLLLFQPYPCLSIWFAKTSTSVIVVDCYFLILLNDCY